MNEEKEDDYFVRLHELLEATNKQNVMSHPNPTTPSHSQVEELQPICHKNKLLFVRKNVRLPRRRTPRRVSFAPLVDSRTSTKPVDRWYPKSWMSWTEFRPEDFYFAGAIRGAQSRKHQGRMKLRVTRRSARPQAEAETVHAAMDITRATKDTRITKRTAM